MKWFLTFALLFPVFWKFTIAENTLSENDFTFKVEAPVQYQVIQRSDQNYAWVDVQVAAPEKNLSKIQLEHRFIINGKTGTWKKADGEWKDGNFVTRLRVPIGGWHTLEVRDSRTPDHRSQVVQFGVGEVFVVAGQSNSGNYGEVKQTTRTGLVSTFDFDNNKWQMAIDPQPGAGGRGGSIMPLLGDLLVREFEMPIGIIAYGQGGTSVREWLPQGSRFPNPPTVENKVRKINDGEWESLGKIYPGFIERMKAFGKNGFRAVLWHQGESDANQKDPTRTLSGPLYEKYLTQLIVKTRTDLEWDVPWFVAQATYHVPGDESDPNIRTAQASLWKNGVALEGPDTDQLKGKLRERDGQGVHFSGPGLEAHADAWFEKVSPWLAQKRNATKYKFSFGAIADCQYCAGPNRGSRHYASSAGKLKECVAELNKHDLEFVIHLGDFIDRDYSSFDKVLPIYQSLQMPAYHALGNHDFDVADELKGKVVERMGMKSKYYEFSVEDWRFIVLDGNDVSFHAYPKNSPKYKDAERYYRENKIRSPRWNGAVGSEQVAWLRKILQKAEKQKEKVAVFCHFPVYPADPHNLWNAGEIISLLEEFSCVKAYINGHNHKGKYGQKNGIHYLTLKGMVETEMNAYSIIRVHQGKLKVTGYGREPDRVLPIK
jgi:predicted phosphodiesterase